MSTDPSITSPDPALAPAPTDQALSSPVPAPESTPPAPAAPDATAPAPAASDAVDPLAKGGVAILTTEDPDGFVTETPCLVLDTFEHDDAEGNVSTFAHVVALPPAAIVKRGRLTPASS